MVDISVIMLGRDKEDIARCKTSLSVAKEVLVCHSEEELGSSLCKISSPWVMFLYAEEVISQPSMVKLKAFVDKSPVDAYSFFIREFSNQTNLLGWKPSKDVAGYTGYVPRSEVRLWRNDKRIGFSLSPHPYVFPSLKKIGAEILQVNDIKINSYPKDVPLALRGAQHQKDPDDVAAAYEYGVALLHTQDFEKAKVVFKRLSKNNSLYRNTLVNLGIALLNTGDAKGAAGMFLSALKNDENDLLALNNLASIFFMAKNFKRAEELYQKALSLDRRDPRLFRVLIQVFRAQGKEDEAKRLLSHGRKMHPNSPMLADL